LLDWFYSRNWMALLTGLPALLAGGAMAAILLVGKSTPNESRFKTYQERAMSALRVGDTAAAEVYFRRMAILDDKAPSSIYGLALTAAQQRDDDRARSLMRRIAPEQGTGYAPAHFWLAKDMVKKDGTLTPRAQELLEHHLTQAVLGDDANWQAHSLLGQLYGARGDAKRVIPHLVQAAQQRPDLKLLLAVLYERQQDPAAARASAKEARDFFRDKAKSDPKVAEYRIQWARSEALLNDYATAVRILREGLKSSQAEPFHKALAEVYLRWYAAVPEDGKGGLAQRLDLLSSALTHGPNNAQALTLLADLATQDWEGSDKALEMLEQVLAQGTAPAMVHAILGTRALKRGDVENASMHLEMAYQGNPQMPAVLNNLAWAIANRDPPDLQRALQLAQAAKKLFKHPEISDTIATILVRLGRYQEAVSELETALRGLPNRQVLHRKLAALYEKLGDTRLAEQHRRLAEQTAPPP
jgi:tetratricopeptide (TPR) repeat protein